MRHLICAGSVNNWRMQCCDEMQLIIYNFASIYCCFLYLVAAAAVGVVVVAAVGLRSIHCQSAAAKVSRLVVAHEIVLALALVPVLELALALELVPEP